MSESVDAFVRCMKAHAVGQYQYVAEEMRSRHGRLYEGASRVAIAFEFDVFKVQRLVA